jgi:hypothetical protein
MERIHALIDKLYQQRQQNCNPAQLLVTVQLLQSELLKLQQKNGTIGSTKVAVTLPVNLNFSEETVRPGPYTKQEENDEPEAEENIMAEMPPAPEAIPMKEDKKLQPVEVLAAAPPEPVQQSRKELHEVLVEKKESLNDRLKEEKKEVVHTLKDTPVRDLRKAIGINDRFTFVNELFRGDEAMYERSIKTINGFHILSEAEYWINRELKFKLGWNDNKELVQHFYQLVRRQFS